MHSKTSCARQNRLQLKNGRRRAEKTWSSICSIVKRYLIILSKKAIIFFMVLLFTVYCFSVRTFGVTDLVVEAVNDDMEGLNSLKVNEPTIVLDLEETLELRDARTFVLPTTTKVTISTTIMTTTTTTTTTTTIKPKETTTKATTSITTTTTTSTIEEAVENEDVYIEETVIQEEYVEESSVNIEDSDTSISEEEIDISSIVANNYTLLCNCVGHEAGNDEENIYKKTGVLVVIFNRYTNRGYNSVSSVIENGGFTGSSSYLYEANFTKKVTPMVEEAVQSFMADPDYYIRAYYKDYGYDVDSFWGDGTHNYFY